MGFGDWGWGIGDWGLGIGPNPQSPIPNPQSPIPKYQIISLLFLFIYLGFKIGLLSIALLNRIAH